MKIELNTYGLCIDSNWFYIALDWKVITIAALATITYKIYKRRKAGKVF